MAKKIVIRRDIIVFCFFPQTIDRCAEVTYPPEVNNITVFNSGIPHGESVVMFAGGHTPPIKGLGLKLE
jgi:hypothetical protein